MHSDDGPANPERLDAAAFATLYREYVDSVYRYCYFRLDGREQAEDATSQIFLKALAALPTHRQRDSFRSWLFSIAHNVVTDLYRSRRPVWPLSIVENHADNRQSVEADALQSVERDEVRDLLARLPAEQRRVLELRLAGLSSSEIAKVLGKKTGAVKVAQSRAIARLRRTLVPDAQPGLESEGSTNVDA
jgi:RNA polymerase sigma-70 factor (ECF subfamily)